jgi:hypothetical protein
MVNRGRLCGGVSPGTHEIDVARWFLGVDYPTTVYSSGSRYHFTDYWEFPELHMANWLDAIRTGAKLNLPIDDGAKTGMLCHLGHSHTKPVARRGRSIG